MKLLISLLIITLSILSANVTMIASPTCKIDAISSQEVKHLFTLKVDTLNTQKVVVIDNADKAVYKDFVKEHIKKSLKKMKVYWIRMIFTGIKQPPRKVALENLENFTKEIDACCLSYTKLGKKPKSWKVINVTH